MRIEHPDKGVLVTGGNSGPGAAIVRAFNAIDACVATTNLAAPIDAGGLDDELNPNRDGGLCRWQHGRRSRLHARRLKSTKRKWGHLCQSH